MPASIDLNSLMTLLPSDKDSLINSIRTYFAIGTGSNGSIKQKTSSGFEFLIAKWFSNVWLVKLVDQTSSDSGFLVRWHGNASSLNGAGSNDTDSIGYFHGYQFMIECTLLTNAHQSSTEFAPATRHYDALVRTSSIDPNNSYIILLSTEFHDDTFFHFKNDQNHKCALWALDQLHLIGEKVQQIRDFKISLTHFNLQELAIQSVKILRDCSSLSEYNSKFEEFIDLWYKSTLKESFLALLAMNSYKYLKDSRQHGRRMMSATEILTALQDMSDLQSYTRAISSSITLNAIRQAIEGYRVAKLMDVSYEFEPLFMPFDYDDVKFAYDSFLAAIHGN